MCAAIVNQFQQSSINSVQEVPPPPYQGYQPPLTQAIHNQTLKLMDFAQNLVTKPQPQAVSHQVSHFAFQPAVAQQAATPTPVNLDFSNKSVNMFNKTETHVHKKENGKEEEKKKPDNGTRVLVGIVGLIGAGVAAFFLGKAVAVGEDVKDEKENFKELKDRWNIHKDCYTADYQLEMNSMIRKTKDCLARKQTHRIQSIALVAFSFLSGVMALSGAIAGSSGWMLGAVAVASCVILSAVFRYGYNCYSKKDEKLAQAIQNSISEMNKINLVIQ